MLAALSLTSNASAFARRRFCRINIVMGTDSVTCSSNGKADTQQPTQRTYQVVVAATRDMGIGKDGKLPWRLPGDLKFFKEITMETSDPGRKNAVVMGRKTWESIPSQFRPLPGRLNIVLTRSASSGVATTESVITCDSISSSLELLAKHPPPHCSLIEKVFLIGGGQLLREALNAPECEAIHITEISTSIQCDTCIPSINMSVYQPWYSSSPFEEIGIQYCFVTCVRLRTSTLGTTNSSNETSCNGSISHSKRLKVADFTFLPKMVFEKHEEFSYLKLVQDIIVNGKGKR